MSATSNSLSPKPSYSSSIPRIGKATSLIACGDPTYPTTTMSSGDDGDLVGPTDASGAYASTIAGGGDS